MDPNGPWYHQVWMAGTNDGVTLDPAKRILDHASVPDGVRLGDGRVLIYYVNGASGSVWVAQVEGDTVSALGPIVLDGVAGPARVVDPDVSLVDGKVRLAYFNSRDPGNAGARLAICLAESQDGVQFTRLGRALAIGAGEILTDPSIIRLPDGGWRLAVSLGQRTIMGRSEDGLSFARYDTLDVGGVPELALGADGSLRLYVCKVGIVAYGSTDGGTTWTGGGTVVPPGAGGAGQRIVCDPSLVAGAGRFVFKTAP